MRTTEPDEFSSKPHRHSNVSGVAKLISSSNTQSPFCTACTRVPSTNRNANVLSVFFCCLCSCWMSWFTFCHSKRRWLIWWSVMFWECRGRMHVLVIVADAHWSTLLRGALFGTRFLASGHGRLFNFFHCNRWRRLLRATSSWLTNYLNSKNLWIKTYLSSPFQQHSFGNASLAWTASPTVLGQSISVHDSRTSHFAFLKMSYKKAPQTFPS